MSTTRPTPYGGLRVVEIATDPAGELAGLQFVHMGAEVIKVEPPEGGPSRRIGPFVEGHDDPDHSLGYWYYNVGKASVVIDTDTEEGLSSLESMLAGADVFICTWSPRDLRERGIHLQQLSERHPRLVIASITPWGLTGPWSEYRSSDIVALAASGLLITSGYDDHSIPPIRPGWDQAYHCASSFAHIAITLGLIERQRSGRGGLIDLSIQESAGVTVELANPYWFYPKGLVKRQTCRHAQPVPTQPAVFRCADGRFVYFALILADPKPWQNLVEWMDSYGVATDLTDPEYSKLVHRQENFAHIQDVLECFFLILPADTVYHEGQARGLPIGVLNAPEDLFVDEQLRAREFFVEIDQPGHGPVTFPGSPYRMSNYAAATMAPAASLGADNDRYLSTKGR